MMNRLLNVTTLILFWFVLATSCSSPQPETPKKRIEILPPEELYHQLFYDIQSNDSLFKDSKTFVDCVPKYNTDIILQHYAKLKSSQDTALKRFVHENFKLPPKSPSYISDSSSINAHINKLWDVLKRPADKIRSGTLIPLPHPYIIPGGRFREIYYWDSYFTMLGLQADGQVQTIQDMVDNFAYLIEKYGYIPNGSRTYYLGRSQPPFFSLMVDLLAGIKGDSTYIRYQPELEREYHFWMDGEGHLGPDNPTYRRVVRLPNGEILNRYWDDHNTPRDESYRQDVKTAKKAVNQIKGLSQEDVYRNLRAAAESGWDFSSRWLTKDTHGNFPLYTIHTTDILPVDLNSLMYHLERVLYKSFSLTNNPQKAAYYKAQADARKVAILKYFWNKGDGYFLDYNFEDMKQSPVQSLAGVYPLSFNITDKEQARKVAKTIHDSFLKAGGVVTTLNNTGQQWDAPNGWAPLQWMTIRGLQNYNYNQLANEIKRRWLNLNQKVYRQTYKMMEKYNVENLSLENGGGEYPTQDGFGWTNGVYQKLSNENHPATNSN
ncbi:MAG TPA: alpha,alpha-trehalase TreF [Sunxiuqinia sp.]|nr:alpha,alpha-trehalase TreF [Sunxiuqinia sp.]